jgi:hypothetical protein
MCFCFLGLLVFLFFCCFLVLFYFVQDVQNQDLVDAIFANSLVPTNEGGGLTNDNVNGTNVDFTQQKSIVVVVASDLGPKRPNVVNSIGALREKMMEYAPKRSKESIDVDEIF